MTYYLLFWMTLYTEKLSLSWPQWHLAFYSERLHHFRTHQCVKGPSSWQGNMRCTHLYWISSAVVLLSDPKCTELPSPSQLTHSFAVSVTSCWAETLSSVPVFAAFLLKSLWRLEDKSGGFIQTLLKSWKAQKGWGTPVAEPKAQFSQTLQLFLKGRFGTLGPWPLEGARAFLSAYTHSWVLTTRL